VPRWGKAKGVPLELAVGGEVAVGRAQPKSLGIKDVHVRSAPPLAIAIETQRSVVVLTAPCATAARTRG
jgi:hypothetical protein